MPYNTPEKLRTYQLSRMSWRVKYNRRYRNTIRGRKYFIRSRHRASLKALAKIEKKKYQINGWPDLRSTKGTLIEIKRGLDWLSPEQIAAHRWIHKHFGVWTQIHYYPRILGAPNIIRFQNYREFLRYCEKS